MEHYIENLLKNINIPHKGFYVEAGANNGIVQSYTYVLENLGWDGILIEPSKISFNECVKNRSKNNIFYNCALVSNDNITKIKGDFNGSLMSSIEGKRLSNNNLIEVECKTITKILDDNNIETIDLFSLDVEGYELEVLKGLDFKKYKPTYFVIEIYTKEYYDIVDLLLNNNYILLTNLTGYNKKDYPKWDGTHNDYLFKLKK